MKTFLYCVILHGILAGNIGAQVQKRRLEALETKLMVLEHYLKERLAAVAKGAEGQQSEINRLTIENSRLRHKVAKLTEEVKLLSAELLRLKIKVAHFNKGEALYEIPTTPTPQNKALAHSAPPVSSDLSDPQVRKWAQRLKAPEPSVRMGAIIQLSRLNNPQAQYPLQRALHDKDIYVQIAACKALARLKIKSTARHLIPLLNASHVAVRRAAHQALVVILQQQVAYDPLAPAEERAAAIEAWQKLAQQ